MWVLLGENILDKFNIDNQSTYLLKVDKTNFLMRKNNSGKSYFLRFLLMNAIKIYIDKIELINDLKQAILSNEINFELFDRIENTNINALSERYKTYITLLDKAYDSKKDSNSRYISNNQKSYDYENEHELLKEMKPLFDYLDIKQNTKFK